MGIREIRVANLPPDVSKRVVSETMAKFGEVMEVRDEIWASLYRYKISNGIRTVKIKLTTHIPSRLIVSGHKVEVTYAGQPATCYACNETGHVFSECPHRRRGPVRGTASNIQSWAEVTAQRKPEMPHMGSESHTTRDNSQRQDSQSMPGCNEVHDTQEEPVLDGVNDIQSEKRAVSDSLELLNDAGTSEWEAGVGGKSIRFRQTTEMLDGERGREKASSSAED
jgi:hypothetical protein